MAIKKVVITDDKLNDENADWIKRVGGGKSNKQELEIHAELAKKAAEEEKRKADDKKG